MGTSTQGGWTIRIPQGAGRTIYVVRFRHAGQRVERSTGKSDPREASIEAARIYSDVVSGRRTARAAVSADLASACASWLADYEVTHASGTAETVTMYVEAHFLPFFASFDRFTAASIADYTRERIQHVTRATLRKELSALRQFFAWCVEHGTVGLPTVPPLPKAGHPGVRNKHARKPVATVISETEMKRLLVAMPERSRRTGEWVRPFFVLLWETGLRESTLLKLRAPEHYRKGGRRLFISRDIDKAHFERHVPLTPAARMALARVYPRTPGPIFEGIDQSSLRHSLDAALRIAGIDKALSPYDVRHSRASLLANSGAPLAGVAHLLGHKHLSTTSLYVQTSERAATEALDAVLPRSVPRAGGRSGGRSPKRARANGGT